MRNKPVVCIGAALIDECFTSLENPVPGTSNPSTCYRSSGGVACNVANHLSLLGQYVELITHFGTDTNGNWLLQRCKGNGIGISNSIISDHDTGRYTAFLSPAGELIYAAVTSYYETEITIDFLGEKTTLLQSASLLLIDCNLNEYCIRWLLEFSEKENIPCIIEPVSIPKAKKLRKTMFRNALLITPNNEEMIAMIGETQNPGEKELVKQLLSRGVKNLWVRNGTKGSKIYSADSMIELAAPKVKVTDTTGAGDAALAGWMYAWLNDKSPADCLLYGHSMASIILQINGAVENNLTVDVLNKTVENYK